MFLAKFRVYLLHGNNPEVVSMHMHGVVVIHVFALVHEHHLHYLP